MSVLDLVKEHRIKEGVLGKVIMVVGDNNTGKTSRLTSAPKSVLLVLEQSALNSLTTANYVDCSTFTKFQNFVDELFNAKQKLEKYKQKVNKYNRMIELEESKLTDDVSEKDKKKINSKIKSYQGNVDKYQEKIDENEFKQFYDIYDKIVVDSVTSFSMLAKEFVLNRNTAVTLGDGDWGIYFKELENEFFYPWHKLLSMGFTILITAHEGQRKVGGTSKNPIYQKYPKGEKKIVKTLIDSCDVVAYLERQYDENGMEMDSCAHFRATEEFFARSKWRNMVPMIEHFTYENLSDAITDAIFNASEEQGVQTRSAKDIEEEVDESIIDRTEELKSKLQAIGELYYIGHGDGDWDAGEPSELFWFFEEQLDEILHGKAIATCTYKQQSHLERLHSKTMEKALEWDLVEEDSELF